MFILGLILGFILGALFIDIKKIEIDATNDLLQKTILDLNNNISSFKSKIEQRDKLIENSQKEHEILLNNSAELRSKITDLENNIELLVNNLSEENKELVDNLQTEN